jgi:phenylalanine ammonia-lyase
MIQALRGTTDAFHSFVHEQKPHRGQIWVAGAMRNLLAESKLTYSGESSCDGGSTRVIQDRYSLRCLPQFLSPIVEGLAYINDQIEVEINSSTDNPLIDAGCNLIHHGGNFLGQHIAVAMDQLRYYLGLVAKHLDVQIALLVSPEFNNGLPPCLIGNSDRRVNMGLKGLQLTGNSLMPMLTFFGNSLADRFPTHAEQFNQNINSQGLGSANLTNQSIRMMQQYVAIALMFAVQAVDLRSYEIVGHYDARSCISPATCSVYEAVRMVAGSSIDTSRPYIFNDHEQILEHHIDRICSDLCANGLIPAAVDALIESLP